jgi:hypothetical protein
MSEIFKMSGAVYHSKGGSQSIGGKNARLGEFPAILGENLKKMPGRMDAAADAPQPESTGELYNFFRP